MVDNRLYWGRYLVLGFFGAVAVPSTVSAEPTRVFAGKTLHELSEFFGIPVRDLEELTNFERVADRNLIQNQEFSGSLAQSAGVNSSSGVQAGVMTYRVRRGDTLYGIARKRGVTLPQIIRANPQIANPDLIFPGQVVRIPERVTVADSSQSGAKAMKSAKAQRTPVVSPRAAVAPVQRRSNNVLVVPVNSEEVTEVRFVQRSTPLTSGSVNSPQTVVSSEQSPVKQGDAKRQPGGLPDDVFQAKRKDLLPQNGLASVGRASVVSPMQSSGTQAAIEPSPGVSQNSEPQGILDGTREPIDLSSLPRYQMPERLKNYLSYMEHRQRIEQVRANPNAVSVWEGDSEFLLLPVDALTDQGYGGL